MNCAFIQFLGICESIYQTALFSIKTPGHTSDEGINIHIKQSYIGMRYHNKAVEGRVVQDLNFRSRNSDHAMDSYSIHV